jgi:hypothetical protein
MEGLEAAAAYIRRELSQILSLRRVPELRFQIDRSVEHAARIHALLAEVLPPDERDGARRGRRPEDEPTGSRGPPTTPRTIPP